MATATHPEIPTDWLKHTEIINGRCLCIHRNHKQEFIVHVAYAYKDGWTYEMGNYCNDLELAVKRFNERRDLYEA